MGSDLHFGYAGGFFAWLVGLAIAVAVVIWVFWIVVFGLLVVAILALLYAAADRARRQYVLGAPARRRRQARRARLRAKPYRIYR